jgi:hypothetical protein
MPPLRRRCRCVKIPRGLSSAQARRSQKETARGDPGSPSMPSSGVFCAWQYQSATGTELTQFRLSSAQKVDRCSPPTQANTSELWNLIGSGAALRFMTAIRAQSQTGASECAWLERSLHLSGSKQGSPALLWSADGSTPAYAPA